MHLDPVWEDAACTPEEDDPLKLFSAVDLDGRVERYLGWSQNDAYVLGWRYDHARLEVTFNHYDVWRLACVLDENRPWRRLAGTFPVILNFSAVTDLEVVRFVEQGAYQKIRASMRDLTRKGLDIRTIICLCAEPSHLAFLFVVQGLGNPFRRSKKQAANPYVDSYYIAFRCAAVGLDERYRDGWIKSMGIDTVRILDEFESIWPVPNWSICEFEAWLEAYG